MTEVRYPPIEAILIAHDRYIEEYGGRQGVRSPDGVEAALARGEQIRAYSPNRPNIYQIATGVAYAFAKIHHPFVDGNKRIAFYALSVILEMNGYYLDAGEMDAAEKIEHAASDQISEEELCDWVVTMAVEIEIEENNEE